MPSFVDNPILPYNRHTFDSGLRLLHKEVQAAPIAAVSIWVSAGAAWENPEEMGISHFLEHMYFKGTERYPLGTMDELVKSLGGYNNAATSYDYTEYYIVLPSEHFEAAYDVLADAFLHIAFPEPEIERERDVIIEEIRRKEDSPQGKLYSDFIQGAFRHTRYGAEVLGTEETLAGIDQARFRDYYRRRYTPQHTIVSIAGNVPFEHAREVTARLFGDFTAAAGDGAATAIEPVREPLEVTLRKDVQQAYFIRGYALPKILGTKEEYALDLAAAILGEGRSSRLYQKLREEESLASSFQAFLWTLEGAALFGLDATCPPADRERVEEIMVGELHRLAHEAPEVEELDRAKRLLTTGFAFENEKAIALASTLGRHEIVGSAEDAVHYTDRINAVTGEDIQRALHQYCMGDGATKVVLLPSKPAAASAATTPEETS